jgi:hypothetical protein
VGYSYPFDIQLCGKQHVGTGIWLDRATSGLVNMLSFFLSDVIFDNEGRCFAACKKDKG